MKNYLFFIGLVLSGYCVSAQSKPDMSQNYTLEFSEDFKRGMKKWMPGITAKRYELSFNAKENSTVKKGILYLKVGKAETEVDKKQFSGAAIQSKEKFSYGLYEIRLRSKTANGLMFSFMTYSKEPPFSLISLELPGQNEHFIAYNHQTTPSVMNYKYDVVENNAEEWNVYGIEWLPDRITWYINGVQVFKQTISIPTGMQHILLSAWIAGNEGWAGMVDPKELPVAVEVDWVKYYKPLVK